MKLLPGERKADRIRAMLKSAAGYTTQQIAEFVGCRPDYVYQVREGKVAERTTKRPKGLCPTCRHVVELPCVACGLRGDG